MTELEFRNITATPDDPVAQWGVEGILTCLERGHLKQWRKLARALHDDNDGVVRQNLFVVLTMLERQNGVAKVFRNLVQAGAA
ncbi:MAG: hypothetical protein LBP28_08275 [Coriobacteriales bacterium]|jgi:hypothetical protein|nr:hypothetical protein [Coriobacteriales bacterium]